MLKEVESLFSTSLWGFDSEAGIFYFVMEGGFMIGSYDQTERSYYFILILVVSPLMQCQGKNCPFYLDICNRGTLS